jgi:hypothetical protein
MLDGTLNLQIKKRNFELIVRQFVNREDAETTTQFWLSLRRELSVLSANMSHIVRNKECFTAIRGEGAVVSHKCYGGLGTGKVFLERMLTENGERAKRNHIFHPTLNLTRTVYDGFRGSGMRWQWVWGVMSGFSKPEFYSRKHTIPTDHWLGLNLGHLGGEGEDFAFLDGQVIPIEGLSYRFNESMGVRENVTVMAVKPRLFANLTVHEIEHKLEDLGVLKLDMVKVHGNWAGEIEGANGKVYKFYEMAGFIERCNSTF